MLVCHPWRFWSGLRLNLNLCSKRGGKKEERRRKMYSRDSDEHSHFKGIISYTFYSILSTKPVMTRLGEISQQ